MKPVTAREWREALEAAWGVEPDPENHTPQWAYDLARTRTLISVYRCEGCGEYLTDQAASSHCRKGYDGEPEACGPINCLACRGVRRVSD